MTLWFWAVLVSAFVIYFWWLDAASRANDRICGGQLQLLAERQLSDCAWNLLLAVPAAAFFWLALLWYALGWRPFGLEPLEIRFAPTRRTYILRFVKSVLVSYLLLYPVIYQVFHLILRDPFNYYAGFFSAFLLRQLAVVAAIFVLIYNWMRARQDPQFIKVYWGLLAALYLLEYWTVPGQAGDSSGSASSASSAASFFHLAAVPHFLLVALAVFGSFSCFLLIFGLLVFALYLSICYSFQSKKF